MISLVRPMVMLGQDTSVDRAALNDALYFHAPFDGGADAKRFTKSGQIQTADSLERNTFTPGMHVPGVSIAQGQGKFGDCLRFTQKVPQVLCFAGTEMHYAEENWSGSVSLWMRLDPDRDLEPGYCDPLVITPRAWNDAALFIDFDKDLPRDFRLGVFSDLAHWNPRNVPWDDWPVAQRPMVVVKNPPFDRQEWTHVAFTFENINPAAGLESRAVLYLNGKPAGSLEQRLQFTWEPDHAVIMLGIYYIGDLDDLMIFRRVLGADEVQYLYQMSESF